MVAQVGLSKRLPAHIAISWRDAATRRWCELEVSGEFLDWLVFREVRPLHEPLMPIAKFTDILDAPQVFMDCYGIVVRKGDIERAFSNYRRRSGGFEGACQVVR